MKPKFDTTLWGHIFQDCIGNRFECVTNSEVVPTLEGYTHIYTANATPTGANLYRGCVSTDQVQRMRATVRGHNYLFVIIK